MTDRNQISIKAEVWPLRQHFTIARGAKQMAETICVEIAHGKHIGRGEAVPYARYGETLENVTALIAELPDGIGRATLQDVMPAGAARNAVDCALWDLEAKQTGRRVWQLAGLSAPGPELTAYTLSLDTPEKMRAEAAKHAHRDRKSVV